MVFSLTEDIEFDEVPGVVAAVHGGNVFLPCIVHGEPPPVISWRFGRLKITSGRPYVSYIVSILNSEHAVPMSISLLQHRY